MSHAIPTLAALALWACALFAPTPARAQAPTPATAAPAAPAARTEDAEVAVEETGEAPRFLKNARQAAMDDARRRCVERAGADMYTQTESQMFRVVRDMVLVKAQGYIVEEQVVAEVPDSAGAYQVRLRARVRRGRVDADALALVKLIGLAGKPRVLVVGGENGKLYEEQFVKDAVLEEFARRGFQVVSPERLSYEQRVAAEVALREQNNPELAAKIARAVKAEYLMVLRSELVPAAPREVGGIRVFPYEASVTLQTIIPGTAAVISSPQAELSRTWPMNKPGDLEARRLVRQGVDQVLPEAIRRLAEHWRDNLGRAGRDLEITLVGATARQVEAVAKKMEGWPAVHAARVTNVSEGGESLIRVTANLDGPQAAQPVRDVLGAGWAVEATPYTVRATSAQQAAGAVGGGAGGGGAGGAGGGGPFGSPARLIALVAGGALALIALVIALVALLRRRPADARAPAPAPPHGYGRP